MYLPPAWFAHPRPALPVLELLHGTPGSPNDWTRGASIDVLVDRWAARHGGRAPIVIMPDVNGGFLADTECADGVAGNAETYLVVDVRCPMLIVTGTTDTQWPRQRYDDLHFAADHVSIDGASHWGLVLNRRLLGAVASAVTGWLDTTISYPRISTILRIRSTNAAAWIISLC